MRFKNTGNKRDICAVVVKNVSTTITIPKGAPVFLDVAAPDGLLVKGSPSVSAAETGANFFGLATADIAPGAYGESIVFGYFDQARIVLTTRTASNGTWQTYSALAIGDYVTALTGTGTGAGTTNADHAMTKVGTAVETVLKHVRLLESLAQSDGSATQASSFTGYTAVSPGNLGTALVAYKKAFIRAM